MEEALPLLTNWMCKDMEHLFTIGLLLPVPYYNLLKLDASKSALTEKYLQLLNISQMFLGDDFPAQFQIVMEKTGSAESFRQFLESQVSLQGMFASRYVVENINAESLLLRFIFEMCKIGQHVSGFDLTLSSNLQIHTSCKQTESDTLSIELFKMSIQAYLRDPLPLFIKQFRHAIMDAFLERHMVELLQTMPQISLWEQFHTFGVGT